MYKRVLVPLDGSELGESIMPFILQIAGPLDIALVLVRVLEPAPPMAVEGTRHFAGSDLAELRRDAADYLAPIAAGLRARGVDVSWEVRVGRPDIEILAAARAAGADLIAMSTHGRSGVGRLLFGSVAEQVLRQAEVPVFLIREHAVVPVGPRDSRRMAPAHVNGCDTTTATGGVSRRQRSRP
jgi:nucleotide-binding universal stress UspA family protein